MTTDTLEPENTPEDEKVEEPETDEVKAEDEAAEDTEGMLNIIPKFKAFPD